MKISRRFLKAGTGLSLCVILTLWQGCSGYQMGDSAAPPFRKVYVSPPVNASLAPQAAALLGTQVARELDRTGIVQVAVAAGDSAEAELEITITRFDREVSADRSDDVGLARKWRLTLVAECTLTDRRTQTAFFVDREVSAFDEIYTDSGTNPAEYQNMPVLTDRLAQKIAREVVAAW